MWDIQHLAIAEFESNSNLLPSESPCFQIKTCQRTLFLYKASTALRHPIHALARRHFEGADAYEFLLRFASGLESEIKGETDVFGQVKNAYNELVKHHPMMANELKTIFTKLFEDTKEIRGTYLQGIGGNTYGALARRLMNPTAADRVLVIGAGQISKSVSPYFADFSMKIWNRSAERLNELGKELTQKGYQNELFTCEKELKSAIQNATLILIATPFGSEVDSLVSKHRSENSRVLHLGAQGNEVCTLPFPSLSLSDLFAIEKEQIHLREKQVRQAMDACRERALLRSLSRSIHVAHGWEDLAVFL